MSIGYQAVQAAHAAIEFQYEHLEIAKKWNKDSKYLIFLTVENELELNELIQKAKILKIKYTKFHEPDINNELTAIAFEPCLETKRLTSNLPLLK